MTSSNTANTIQSNINEADELWRQAEFQDPSDHRPVYDFLKELDKTHPDNVKIKWRLARACKDMSETANLAKNTAKQYAYEGKAVAARGVELDPNVWEAQMFLGALLGVCSRFEVFHKLGSAGQMKECFQKACDLANDSSPEPYHSLGCAEFGFADAGTAARLVGLKGTYESALNLFFKAESLCPHPCYDNQGGHYNRNWLMIVRALMALGRMEEARQWHAKLLEADVNTHDDRTAVLEARKLKI